MSLYFNLYTNFRLIYHENNKHIHNINTDNENVNATNNEIENEYTQNVNINSENRQENVEQCSTNVVTQASGNITLNLSEVNIMIYVLY